MAFLNLLGRLGLDTSDFYSKLTGAEVKAKSTSGQISNSFKQMGKAFMAGLGVASIQQLLAGMRQVQQDGKTIAEQMEAAQKRGDPEDFDRAQRRSMVAVQTEDMTGTLGDVKDTILSGLGYIFTILKGGTTPGAALAEINAQLARTGSNPVLEKKITESVAEHRTKMAKESEELAKAFRKAAKDEGLTTPLTGTPQDVQRQILRVLERMEQTQKANEGPLF